MRKKGQIYFLSLSVLNIPERLKRSGTAAESCPPDCKSSRIALSFNRSYDSAVRHDLVGRIAEEEVAPIRAPLRDAQGEAVGALVEGDPGYAQALAVLARPHVHRARGKERA